MRVAVCCLLLIGCGRVGFEPNAMVSGDSDAASSADALVLADGPAGSITQVFGECPDATVTGVTRDTFLDEGRVGENFGGRDEFRIDDPASKVALLRFELASIPATATVLSAELVITVSSGDALEEGEVDLVTVLEPWTEGTGDYELGISNWMFRESGTAWLSPGAGAPMSRGTAVLGTFVPRLENVTHVIAIDAAAIDAWVADPGSNHGFALVGRATNGQGGWLHSSDASDPAVRPCLSVIYYP